MVEKPAQNMGLAVQFTLLFAPAADAPYILLKCVFVTVRRYFVPLRTMAFHTAGIIHYLTITSYFVHDYITVVLKTLLAVWLIAL